MKNGDLCKEEGLWFPFKNWSEFLSIKDLSIQIGEKIGQRIKLWGNMVECKGSISFEVDGIVYGKLAPMNPDYPVLMIGFSCKADDPETYARELGEPELYLLSGRKELFLMVSTNPISQHDTIIEAMSGFLEDVIKSGSSWWLKFLLFSNNKVLRRFRND